MRVLLKLLPEVAVLKGRWGPEGRSGTCPTWASVYMELLLG